MFAQKPDLGRMDIARTEVGRTMHVVTWKGDRGSEKMIFPAWLQFMKMFKHKMLENILSIPYTLFQPVNLILFLNCLKKLYFVKNLQKLKKVLKLKLISKWMHQV
jgi:hypothetical protein